MTSFEIARVALVAQASLFVLFCLLWPLFRLWKNERVLGIVAAQRGVERVVVVAMIILLIGYVAWAALFAQLGPAELDVWSSPAVLTAAGVVIQLVGLGVVALSQLQMGASWRIGIDADRHALVTRGLYRYIRHPIYTGVLLVALATTVVTPSAWTLCASAIALLLIALQARLEEDHLLRQHGTSYRAYAAETGRFLPWIGRVR